MPSLIHFVLSKTKTIFFEYAILELIIMLTQAPVDESAIFAAVNKNLKSTYLPNEKREMSH